MEGLKFRSMLTEVNDVLKTHFDKMVEKVKQEVTAVEQTTKILRELPLVRALDAEIEKHKADCETLRRRNLTLLQENVMLKARMKAAETERVSLEIEEIEGANEDLSGHIYGACSAAADQQMAEASWAASKALLAEAEGGPEESEAEESGSEESGAESKEEEEEEDSDGEVGAGADEVAAVDGGSEDADVEVEELEVGDKMYYTDNKESGTLYECLSDGEIGDEVGHLENGHVFFS